MTRSYESDALAVIAAAHPGKPALPMRETAQLVGYTYDSFRSVYGDGGIDIPSYRAGRHRWFSVHDIARYLARQRRQGQIELKAIKHKAETRRQDQLAKLKTANL